MADMVFLTRLKPEPMGTYNASTAYGVNSLVMSEDGAAAYLSVKDVPAGTPLTNTQYWKIHTDLSLVKQNAEEAAAKALAARNEMIGIARNLTTAAEAEGNPVRAELVGGLPFDKVVTKLEPVQAGSGDPYTAGCGPNLLPYVAETTMNGATLKTLEDGGVHISGTPTSNTFVSFACNIALDGSYVFSMGNAEAIGDHLQMRLLDASGSMGNTNFNAASADAYTIVAASKTITQFVIRLGSGIAYDVTIYPQLIAGTEKQEFHPFENIRPISGRTGAEMVHAGANLIDDSIKQKPEGKSEIYIGSTNNTAGATLPAGMYTFSVIAADGQVSNLYVRNADTNENIAVGYNALSVAFELSETTPVRLHVYKASYTGTADIVSAQLEVGSAATEYEPYQGSDYSADFGQTVYGGELDWQTGVLTADRKYKELDGTENWTASSTQFVDWLAFNLAVSDKYGSGVWTTVISNMFRSATSSEYNTGRNESGGVGGVGGFGSTLTFKVPRTLLGGAAGTNAEHVNDFKTWLADMKAAGTPVQVVYMTNKPDATQLTAQELAQLEGVNTLYGDAIIAITGRQRPDLALVSRIEALESAILNA